MDFDFFMPTALKFGSGRFNDTSNLIKGLGNYALIVTGRRSMERLGYTKKLSTLLREVNIKSCIYNKISPSPTINEIDEGANLAKEVGVDFIIALGGGSAIDGAKAIAVAAVGNSSISDYLYKIHKVPMETLPIVAIPTTAGTGSEMNRSAIIRDRKKNIKDGLRSDYIFPKIAIVDPELSHNLPKQVTIETGFDALTHAIESYVSPKANPITDSFSIMAIENISKHLPIVLKEYNNIKSREKISLSSALMGYNLSFVGTCFPHRIDKSLCALHPEISHGQSLAVFYSYWAKMSWRGNITKFSNISKIIDKSTVSLSVEESAMRFPQIILNFMTSIGIKTKISELGINTNEIPMLIRGVAGDLSINPVPICRKELHNILKMVFQQK